MKLKLYPLLLCLLFILPTDLFSHALDQSYVFLRINKSSIEGRLEMSPADINKILGTNFGAEVTLEELEPILDQLQRYYKERVAFSSEAGEHPLEFTTPSLLFEEGVGNFVQLNFEMGNTSPVPDVLDTRYEVMFDQNRQHVAMLVIEYNWKAGIHNNERNISLTYTPIDTKQKLNLSDSSIFRGTIAMIKSGMWHIWIGIDHILFLLALILPAVVRRKNEGLETGSWEPVDRFKPAFIYIIKIVTLFTIAHTITLSCAATGVIELPSRLVESVIALSIALAALHNIKPLVRNEEMIIAFGFGLFHGFGFASVLGDVGLTGEFMAFSLLGFNVGVELAQIAIIILIFPVLYLIRKSSFYPKILLYGSIILIVIALYWFVERGFGVDIPLVRMLKSIF